MHPDPDVDVDGGDNGDSYANPKSRSSADGRQRTNRVVQGALCFSPVATNVWAREDEEVETVAGISPDKWTSTPSTSDFSTSSGSSSHYSALTHPLAHNHPFMNNHFSRSSTGKGQGRQLLTTPMLQSIPRGYSFLLSLAQGHPTNPRTQQKQVRTLFLPFPRLLHHM